MAFDDLKLLFETERRLLRRRMQQFLPKQKAEPAPPKTPAPIPKLLEKPKKGRRRQWMPWHVVLSAVVHRILLAILLPHWVTPERPREKPPVAPVGPKKPPPPEKPEGPDTVGGRLTEVTL